MKQITRSFTLLMVMVILIGCGQVLPTATPTATPEPSGTPTQTPTITPTPIPVLQGIAYSPYRDCQSPDSTEQPSREDIMQDLEIISQMANGIRTYSSTGINADVPALARAKGLRVSVGIWLTNDREANEREIAGLITLANTVDLESVIVGNEVLLRNDLTESELITYILRVKDAVNVPVTTAEIGGILLQHPKVMEAVDFQMVHLYPFWDGKPIEGAAQVVANDYHAIQDQSGGKRVVIGETGWPAAGPVNGSAVPSPENQARFAKEFLTVASAENIEFYYFDAFDEMWKTEGGVGAYWGLLSADRNFKYDIQSVTTSYNAESLLPEGDTQVLATPQATPQSTPQNGGTSSDEFYVYSNFGSESNHFAPGGWMGDLDSIGYACSLQDQTWPETAIQISYSPNENNTKGWAGIYWLQPDHNWGTIADAGYDLSEYKQLIFQARAETPGTQIKFFVGGVSTTEEGIALPYSSSINTPLFSQEADPTDGFVNLTDAWQDYHFDVTGLDLQYVIDGFGWAAERARTPDGAIFYLDNIRFVRAEPGPAPIQPVHIYNGEFLREGLFMGVDSSGGLHDWVEDQKGVMKISYAAWQDWAVVYITVGPSDTRYGYRNSIDLSNHQTLSVDLKGESGGEIVYIGIKDRNQVDNGGEPKIKVELTNEWKTYTFDLHDFYPAGTTFLERIYIPIEFVFEPTITKDEVIYFRNVQYLP